MISLFYFELSYMLTLLGFVMLIGYLNNVDLSELILYNQCQLACHIHAPYKGVVNANVTNPPCATTPTL